MKLSHLVFGGTFLIVMSGCAQTKAKPQAFDWDKYPIDGVPADVARIAPFSSADGTFLLDSVSRKVWKYDAKLNAFVEIPLLAAAVSQKH